MEAVPHPAVVSVALALSPVMTIILQVTDEGHVPTRSFH